MEYEIKFPEKQKAFIFTISTNDGVSMKEVIGAVSNLGFVKKLEIKG